MSQKIDFTDLLKRHGFQVVDDPALEKIMLNGFPGSSGSFLKGYYNFIDGLSEPEINFHGNFYLVARAIAYILIDDKYYGHIGTFNISTLVSSFSIYEDDEGRQSKGSILYARKSSQANDVELKIAKYEFLKSNVMGKTVQIIKAEKSNEVIWKFVASNSKHPYENNYTPTLKLKKFQSI